LKITRVSRAVFIFSILLAQYESLYLIEPCDPTSRAAADWAAVWVGAQHVVQLLY